MIQISSVIYNILLFICTVYMYFLNMKLIDFPYTSICTTVLHVYRAINYKRKFCEILLPYCLLNNKR